MIEMGHIELGNPIAVIALVLGSILASSGFWAFIGAKKAKSSATTRLIMGLANDRIQYLGMQYIMRGHISKDEFEDFIKYLYEPYKELGGNGTAERIMHEVEKLPFAKHPVLKHDRQENNA